MVGILTNFSLAIIFAIILIFVYFWNFIFNRERPKFKRYFKDNVFLLILCITFYVGFLSRTLCLDLLPGGLNQDEASAGYDAFSIMKWGVDRNGCSFPVHLISWGSGQNALYSYFAIPFIAMMGLNEFSIRLPMALVGCITLVVFYKLLDKQYDKKIAYLGLVFLIINPWHFMKSRWGLESNIFPDMVLLATYFLLSYVRDFKVYKLVISSVVFGLSSYSYGTSYFFLFFFVIASLIYLLATKKMNWKYALMSLSIIGVICIPIIIFLGINLFDGETIVFLGITIPKLPHDRFHTTTTLFSDTFFKDAWDNFKIALKMFITQNDNLPFNTIPYIGYVYLFATPFMIYGLFNKDKDNNEFNWVFKIWLIVTVFMSFIIKSNTNRLNVLFFPMILFTFMGVYKTCLLIKKSKFVFITYYATAFSCFLYQYMGPINQKISYGFFNGLGDAIKYADGLDENKTINITKKINMPYIFVLFYTEYDVHDFIDTVQYTGTSKEFRQVSSFGRYKFGLDNYFEKDNIYIVDEKDSYYVNLSDANYNKVRFDRYFVISEK